MAPAWARGDLPVTPRPLLPLPSGFPVACHCITTAHPCSPLGWGHCLLAPGPRREVPSVSCCFQACSSGSPPAEAMEVALQELLEAHVPSFRGSPPAHCHDLHAPCSPFPTTLCSVWHSPALVLCRALGLPIRTMRQTMTAVMH